MHAKAQFAIAKLDALDIWIGHRWGIMRTPPVWLQVRIEIAVIAEVDSLFQAFVIKYKSAILRGPRIQEQQAQAGGLRVDGREIENQSLNSQRRLPLPKIIQPDQTESENAVGMAGIRCGADGRPSRGAMPQECARVCGRKRVFQVRLGAQLSQFVGRKLAAQKWPELLAETQPGAAKRQVVAHCFLAIDQFQGALQFPEAGHLEHQFAAGFTLDGNHATHQVAPLIPGLQLGARAVRFHHKIFRSNGQPLLARLAQHGIEAGFEKTAYSPQNLGGEGFGR